jgi:hypothetical protein
MMTTEVKVTKVGRAINRGHYETKTRIMSVQCEVLKFPKLLVQWDFRETLWNNSQRDIKICTGDWIGNFIDIFA